MQRRTDRGNRRAFGTRLMLLGVTFVFLAPVIMLLPGASHPDNAFGIIWAVPMSLACGVALLLVGLSLRG